ncbi:hypothetical protein OJAV_G00065640 [Oryzias javanicus]|uniref:Secreted protein n=1 Tax=Oryzias javanicus TaxID=123683 RepID=A0A3S2UGP9_ORYJA|nr:hypothetical protein OJAV_G00065640 [Oryzias javanicus]
MTYSMSSYLWMVVRWSAPLVVGWGSLEGSDCRCSEMYVHRHQTPAPIKHQQNTKKEEPRLPPGGEIMLTVARDLLDMGRSSNITELRSGRNRAGTSSVYLF